MWETQSWAHSQTGTRWFPYTEERSRCKWSWTSPQRSHLHNGVLLGAGIWIPWSVRYGPLSRSTGEDGGTALLDRLTSSWSNKSPFDSHSYCQRACGHRQCDQVFREKAHLWHDCHNPESNEHCLMILSVSSPFPDQVLENGFTYDRWRVC